MTEYDAFTADLGALERAAYEADLAETKALLDTTNLLNMALREAGIKQKDLAAQLNVTQGYVSRVMSGTENLTLRTVARFLYALGKQYIQACVSRDSHYHYIARLPEPGPSGVLVSYANHERAVSPFDWTIDPQSGPPELSGLKHG